MRRPRTGFDAALLRDGSVLVVGDDMDCMPGAAVEGSERAELFDLADGAWVEVESLNKPRQSPATVVLPDGSVMVIGGINSDDEPFSSTKLFSPASRSWKNGPLLNIAHGHPSAVTMGDGRVLLVTTTGGAGAVEIYDPADGLWRYAAATPAGTEVMHLIALRDDRVLALGVDVRDTEELPAAWIYETERDAWQWIEPPVATYGTEVVPLHDGGALAVGGLGGGDLTGRTWSGAQVLRLDPATWRWREVAPMSTARLGGMVVALQDGRVLAAGGRPEMGGLTTRAALRTAEIYDPAADRWAAIPDLLEPRSDGVAILLADGSVLVMGGSADVNSEGAVPWCPAPMTTVERYWPA